MEHSYRVDPRKEDPAPLRAPSKIPRIARLKNHEELYHSKLSLKKMIEIIFTVT